MFQILNKMPTHEVYQHLRWASHWIKTDQQNDSTEDVLTAAAEVLRHRGHYVPISMYHLIYS